MKNASSSWIGISLLGTTLICVAATCVTTIHNGPAETDSCATGDTEESGECIKTTYNPPVPGCVELTINTFKDCSWDGKYQQNIKKYNGVCTDLVCVVPQGQQPFDNYNDLWDKPVTVDCVID